MQCRATVALGCNVAKGRVQYKILSEGAYNQILDDANDKKNEVDKER